MSYAKYFDIDPKYYSSISEDLLKSKAIDWRKYYPHETFVELLKTTEKVLSRQSGYTQCIWVEGAYGTGKSHAVLTLKKLLDATNEEVEAYFKKYNLKTDLFNKFKGLKNTNKILSVHRYVSSDIKESGDLFIAIQESIRNALIEQGYSYTGADTLKTKMKEWLSKPTNKAFFEDHLRTDCANIIKDNPVSVTEILNRLEKFTGGNLSDLVNGLIKIGNKSGLNAFRLDVTGLKDWITDVIEKNGLAIFFIWDEFTDYFRNNKNSAHSEFQEILQLAATQPFTLLIVTHKSEELFSANDNNGIQLLGRFVKPRSKIELPPNMAFKLIGAALEKKLGVEEDWKQRANDLNAALSDSRKIVEEKAGISEEELKGVLPLHPFAAFVLKYLSTSFVSNQRSMFDFIKNDRGDDIKAFQWFIKNVDPVTDMWNLLTVDMLWDFFYCVDRDNLKSNIREVLDSFNRLSEGMTEDQTRVLKALLLLGALSRDMGDAVEILRPDEKNLATVFDGTQLENGAAVAIAENLVRDGVLFRKQIPGSNKTLFTPLAGGEDTKAIKEIEDRLRVNKKTKDLIIEGNFESEFSFTNALGLRCIVGSAGLDTLKPLCNRIRDEGNKFANRIPVVFTFAKDDSEHHGVGSKIIDIVADNEANIVFVDASLTALGPDEFSQYIQHMARCEYWQGKDNGQSVEYENRAKDVLSKWRGRIKDGSFQLYGDTCPSGKRCVSFDDVVTELKNINHMRFKRGIESYNVSNQMFVCSNLAAGALCGIKQETSGTFRSSNAATKLEKALEGAWGVDKYWEINSNILISHIKKDVDGWIKKAFDAEGKIAIRDIFDQLKTTPYGFMPCNLTAFILGFLLKEYACDQYYSEDNTNSDPMTQQKMKDMIDEVIKLENTPNPRYKDKLIVAMSNDEKTFRKVTAKVFRIQESYCTSISQTRDKMRGELKTLAFPIWCLKSVLDDAGLITDREVIKLLIDSFVGVANARNIGFNKTETDFALNIGRLCMANPTAIDDLVKLVTKENTLKGMKVYLAGYRDGLLPKLAEQIGDLGEYLSVLKGKFDADAANWAWNEDTVNERIDDEIVEYSIIAESNKLITKTTTFQKMSAEWCDRLSLIKVSYEASRTYLDDFGAFAAILHDIKRTGIIVDTQKKTFLELLETKSCDIKTFFDTQPALFKKIGSFWLSHLTDEEQASVYALIPDGQFTQPKSAYLKLIEDKRDEFIKGQLINQLRELWKAKSGSGSPSEWSKQHKTPVLCIVEDNIVSARKAFDILNRGKGDDEEVRNAIAYLKIATFWDAMSKQEKIDDRFSESIVKNYKAVLPDVGEVRQYLIDQLPGDPFEWYQSAETERKIKEFAQARYDQIGCDKVLSRIEKMPPDKLKSYLKELIKDNMVVGLEILNDNKE